MYILSSGVAVNVKEIIKEKYGEKGLIALSYILRSNLCKPRVFYPGQL